MDTVWDTYTEEVETDRQAADDDDDECVALFMLSGLKWLSVSRR